MMDVMKFKIPLATVSGLIAAWFGHVWTLIILAVVAILLDYATGLLAGRINEGLNSKRATRGLYKKVGFLFLLALGFFLDVAFNHFIAQGFNGFQLPFDLPIGLIVSVWIVVTEAISICENLERLGVPIPEALVKLLKRTRDSADESESL